MTALAVSSGTSVHYVHSSRMQAHCRTHACHRRRWSIAPRGRRSFVAEGLGLERRRTTRGLTGRDRRVKGVRRASVAWRLVLHAVFIVHAHLECQCINLRGPQSPSYRQGICSDRRRQSEGVVETTLDPGVRVHSSASWSPALLRRATEHLGHTHLHSQPLCRGQNCGDFVQ